jgi:uncharacterized protein (DUF2384 family)
MDKLFLSININKNTMTAKKLLIEMSEITSIGLDVFGNMDQFNLWLDTPNFALGNLNPKELLKNLYGKELVISELMQINYGILL